MNDKSEINAVLSHLFNVRIQRQSTRQVFVRLGPSDPCIIHEKVGLLGG